MRIHVLQTAIIAAMGTLLCGCATMHSTDSQAGIGHYQFGYSVSSPSNISAQVFSGAEKTYVSLPNGVDLQAATGNGHLYTPHKNGHYWIVPALATSWSFATTQGIVNAKASGAAFQMARVQQAISTVQSTVPVATHKPSIQVTMPIASAKPLPTPASMKTPVNKTESANPETFKMPTSWEHASLVKTAKTSPLSPDLTPHKEYHGSRIIPGSDGRSLPLKTALHHIAPMGWHTHIGKDVSPSIPVLWHKGVWTESLRRMARDNLMVSTVDAKTKTIHISASPAMLVGIPGQESIPAAHSVKPSVRLQPGLVVPSVIHDHKHPDRLNTQEATPPPAMPAASAAPAWTAMPSHPILPITPPMPVIFLAHHNQMLSHDLRLYLQKTHWHLAWNVQKDYPISVGFSLTGNVHEVLKKLMQLYPITVTAYAVNRTIEITSSDHY